MTNCVIEINDFELRAMNAAGAVTSSPGYASAVDGNVDVGAAALTQAQVHPRTTENRFWRDLNTAPIHHFGKRARHHGDLAYLHLEHLRKLAGQPAEAVFAVPGSLSHEQLALLLGIAQACRLKPLALVDSAVAAAAAALGSGHWAHVDLQQHQAVVTTLEVDTAVRRGAVEVLPGLGINAIRTACVQAITRAFVAHCRFDPLHHAATEQLLHDQLPRWLELLATSPEISVQLAWRGTRFDTRIARSTLVTAVAPLLTRLRAALPAGLRHVASHRLAQQPGYVDTFGATPVLDAGAVFAGLRQPLPSTDGIRLVTTLPACSTPSITAPIARGATAATHVLDHHTAAALSRTPLHLLARGGFAQAADPLAWCSVALGASGVAELTTQDDRVRVNGQAVSGRVPLAAGDQITFSGAAALFTMIAVLPADAA